MEERERERERERRERERERERESATTFVRGVGALITVKRRFFPVYFWLIIVSAASQVHLRNGSAETNARAATLRQKLQIKLLLSPRHSSPTPRQPTFTLTI